VRFYSQPARHSAWATAGFFRGIFFAFFVPFCGYFKDSEMADWFYCVDLSRDEDSARDRRNVEKFLVELICADHSNERHHESYRETSACDIAMSAFENRYGSQAEEDIGYKRANRYRGIVPTNLGEASFTASCGCLAWHF
jgi:hypothetical protein